MAADGEDVLWKADDTEGPVIGRTTCCGCAVTWQAVPEFTTIQANDQYFCVHQDGVRTEDCNTCEATNNGPKHSCQLCHFIFLATDSQCEPVIATPGPRGGLVCTQKDICNKRAHDSCAYNALLEEAKDRAGKRQYKVTRALTKCTGAPKPGWVTHAITLAGAELAWAMLAGFKRIENRDFRMSPGWYALHVGDKPLSKERFTRFFEGMEDVPTSLTKRVIVGAIKIRDGLPLATVDDEWAEGPICNIIEAFVQLEDPCACKGALSTWPIVYKDRLKDDELERLQERLAAAPIQENNISDLIATVEDPEKVETAEPAASERASEQEQPAAEVVDPAAAEEMAVEPAAVEMAAAAVVAADPAAEEEREKRAHFACCAVATNGVDAEHNCVSCELPVHSPVECTWATYFKTVNPVGQPDDYGAIICTGCCAGDSDMYAIIPEKAAAEKAAVKLAWWAEFAAEKAAAEKAAANMRQLGLRRRQLAAAEAAVAAEQEQPAAEVVDPAAAEVAADPAAEPAAAELAAAEKAAHFACCAVATNGVDAVHDCISCKLPIHSPLVCTWATYFKTVNAVGHPDDYGAIICTGCAAGDSDYGEIIPTMGVAQQASGGPAAQLTSLLDRASESSKSTEATLRTESASMYSSAPWQQEFFESHLGRFRGRNTIKPNTSHSIEYNVSSEHKYVLGFYQVDKVLGNYKPGCKQMKGLGHFGLAGYGYILENVPGCEALLVVTPTVELKPKPVVKRTDPALPCFAREGTDEASGKWLVSAGDIVAFRDFPSTPFMVICFLHARIPEVAADAQVTHGDLRCVAQSELGVHGALVDGPCVVIGDEDGNLFLSLPVFAPSEAGIDQNRRNKVIKVYKNSKGEPHNPGADAKQSPPTLDTHSSLRAPCPQLAPFCPLSAASDQEADHVATWGVFPLSGSRRL